MLGGQWNRRHLDPCTELFSQLSVYVLPADCGHAYFCLFLLDHLQQTSQQEIQDPGICHSCHSCTAVDLYNTLDRTGLYHRSTKFLPKRNPAASDVNDYTGVYHCWFISMRSADQAGSPSGQEKKTPCPSLLLHPSYPWQPDPDIILWHLSCLTMFCCSSAHGIH